MRFAMMLAAAAALWVQPAKAAVYVGTLTSGSSGAIFPGISDPTIIAYVKFSRPVTGSLIFDFTYDEHEYINGVYMGGNDYFGSDLVSFADQTIAYLHHNLPQRRYYGNGRVEFSGKRTSHFRLDVEGLDHPVDFSFTVLGFGVPEPAAWAFLILGFGAIGAAMRRRHDQALPDTSVTAEPAAAM